MGKSKTWKASIWLCGEEEKEIKFFGPTLASIREDTAKWLTENEPDEFANSSANHEITRRYTYTRATEERPLKPGGSTLLGGNSETITTGWIGIDGGERYWNKYDHFETISEAVKHFVSSSLTISKGPDWQEIELVENNIPLHLIRTVKRVEEEDVLNDYLQNGWYLLAIDCSGGVADGDYRLQWRHSEYIIGHTEENADLSILQSQIDDEDNPIK